MYYAKARLYDADNRRFTAVDPILNPSLYDISEYATDPMELVQYLYVKDNAIIYVDLFGLKYSLAEGSIAHAEISAYVKFLYPEANIGAKINGVARTKSHTGYADIIIPSASGIGYEVYEIKSSEYQDIFGRYNVAGVDQLESYVFAINNFSAQNEKYYPAVEGTSLFTSPIYLPYLPDSTKTIKVYTDYKLNPGMIFYDILSMPKKSPVIATDFVTDKLEEKIKKYMDLLDCPEYSPALGINNYVNMDSYEDKEFNTDVLNWLNSFRVSAYTDGPFVYTKITFPEGNTYYRFEGIGFEMLYWPYTVSHSEKLAIGLRNEDLDAYGWKSTPTVDWAKAWGFGGARAVLPVPPVAPVPVPVF